MLEKLDTTFTQLKKYLVQQHPELPDHEIDMMVNESIINNGGLEYYVHLFNYELCDISPLARVKSPVKYFKKYEQAKIFQLKSILMELDECSISSKLHRQLDDNDIRNIKADLNRLVTKYPEYAI